RGKEYDNAISFIRAARTLIKNKPDVTSKFNYYLGICYLKLDMPYFALFYFEKNKMCLKSKLFAGISNIYLHNCDSAIAKFNTIITYNDETAIKDVAKRLIIYCTVGRRNGRKIPIVAGSLSVIPGLGYVYTKHYQSALSALMLNSLLLGSSYEFHKRGYKAVSITSLAIAITWYIGNIYGAIASAKRVNEKSEKDFFEEIFRGFPDLLEL
ncbi:MAG: hypothetical protein U9R19_08910, partial [Bacteroidota bacterium]|nr:hypothetical protein [Bacteroidota bacterium]